MFRDIAPEGENLEETNANLDQLTDLALELQDKTGVKLLWATCNLFANPRYAIVALVFQYSHLGGHSLVEHMAICSQVYIDISLSSRSLEGISCYLSVKFPF